MARIREAQIDDDGRILLPRRRRAGVLPIVIALGLIVGGVWLFDSAYGEPRGASATQLSETASN